MQYIATLSAAPQRAGDRRPFRRGAAESVAMYCIDCGAPIEASARICGACRFPQPLEEFADVEPLQATAGGAAAQKPVFPVKLEEPPRQRRNSPRLAAAIAVFIALCISTGLSMYLLTRPHAAPDTPSSQVTTTSPPTQPSPATRAETPARDPSGDHPLPAQDRPADEPRH
jgi:hypothetical protein